MVLIHRILDISPSEEKLLTWPEIRGDLARETGNDKVTVPTLKLSSREYLTDSWVIAEYVSPSMSNAILEQSSRAEDGTWDVEADNSSRRLMRKVGKRSFPVEKLQSVWSDFSMGGRMKS